MRDVAKRVKSHIATVVTILAFGFFGIASTQAQQPPPPDEPQQQAPPPNVSQLQLPPSNALTGASTSQKAASGSSSIEVEDWIKPEYGWLYVLDPQPQPGKAGGRIWLLDPDTGKVMGRISAGSNPDFALSPDGASLYVASDIDRHSSDLAVIDTATGAVLQRATIENRLAANGIPPFSSMAVSDDGRALRILVSSPDWPEPNRFQLATFDTQTGSFLRQLNMGNCGYGRFISYPTANEFDFLCPTSNHIRHIALDPQSSRNIDNSFVAPPWPRQLGIAQALLAPGEHDMLIVRGDGAVYSMDVATATFTPTQMRGDSEGRILPAVWPTSPDGTRIYLGYDSSLDPRFYLEYGRSAILHPRTETAGELRVFDTDSWQRLGIIKTSVRFWSAVAGKDGRFIYALAPKRHSVLAIDTATMRQTRTIRLGGAPALALVAP